MLFTATNAGQPINPLLRLHACDGRTPHCNCTVLTKVDNIKYLGLTIDYRLKWTTHIQNLTNRLRKLIYIFANLRRLMPDQTLIMVYYALCQSLLTYGIAAWGGAFKTNLSPLQTIQNILLRIILKKPRLYPTIQLYQNAMVLNIYHLYLQSILILYQQHPSLRTPIPHSYETRHRTLQSVSVPKVTKTFGQNHFMFHAPKIYNKLPLEIKSITHIHTYKKQISKWLLTLQNTDHT